MPAATAQTASDLAPSALSVSTTPIVAGGPISVSHSVVRTGDEIEFSWADAFYLSTDSTFDGAGAETFLGTNTWQEDGSDSYTLPSTITLPQVPPGTYHLFVVVDGYDGVPETDETNNVMGIALNVTAPNLIPTHAWFTNAAVCGQAAEVNFTIANNGGAPTHDSWWYDSIYLSEDDHLDETDTWLGSPWLYGPIGTGDSYTQSLSVIVPDVPSGGYHLIVRSDFPDNRVAEGDEDDNTAAFPVAVLAPNLVPTAAWFTTTPVIGLGAEVNFTVANQGNTATHDSWWNDSVYLSDDNIYDESDIPLGTPWRYGPVEPGTDYTHTLQITVPSVTPGSYYLVVRADTPDNRVAEGGGEANDVAFPVTLTAANLTPTDAWFTLGAASGETLEVNLSVMNNGDATIPDAGWTDQIYLSADDVFDESDTFLWNGSKQGPLAPGASYQSGGLVTVPSVPPGTYYLIVTADLPYNHLPESDETDNTTAYAIQVGTPDLQPDHAGFEGLGMSGETATVTFMTRNTGDGSVGGRTWYDRVYLSADDQLDGGDTLLVNHFAANGPVGPDATYTISAGCQIPAVNPGTYHLIVSSDDYQNLVPESDETNNVRAFEVWIAGPDLVPAAAGFVGGAGASGETSRVSFTIRNSGEGGVAFRGWWDRVFFSQDDVYDGGDTLMVDHTSAGGPLPPNGEYIRAVDVSVPQVPAGIYYLIVVADDYMNYLPESDENNNTQAFQVNVVSPDLRPDAAAFHDGPASSGENATVDFTVRNAGAGGVSARGWWDRVYLSNDAVWDEGDHLLVNHTSAGGPLAAAETYSRSIPVALPLVPAGTYYLLVSTDDYMNYLIESDETNNVRAFEVTVVAPDLIPSALVVTSGVPASEATLGLEFTILNDGAGPAPTGRNWWDMVYLSNDPVLDTRDSAMLAIWPEAAGMVAPGGSYTTPVTVTLPTLDIGTYYLIVSADFWSNNLFEENDENNATAFPIKIGPDLEPQSAAITGGPAVSGRSANLTVVSENTGNAEIGAEAIWSDRIWLSTDAVLDEGDTLLESAGHGGPMASGATQTNDLAVDLPAVPPGDYYLILACDSYGNQVMEADETNNIRAYPQRITAPDLVVSAATPHATQVIPGQSLVVDFTITNQGDGAVFNTENWSDDLWFSTDAVWDAGDTMLGGPWSRSGPFVQSAYYESSRTVGVPTVEPGFYHLIVRTDPAGQVHESDNSNNVRVIQIEVLAPDLVPQSLAVTGQILQGRPFTCEITVANDGQSPVPAGPWADTLHLSADATLDAGDVLLGGPWSESGPLAAGAGYTRSRTLGMPNVTAGQWYLIVNTDRDGDIAEANETNNVHAFAVTVSAVDLAPTAVVSGTPLVAGTAASLTVTVANQGDGAVPAAETWSDHLYFSADAVLDGGDTQLGGPPAASGPLGAGANYQRIYQASLPAVTAGTYYLIAGTDITGGVLESNESNNRLAVHVEVFQMDLAPVALSLVAGDPLVAGQPNAIQYEIANQGGGSVPADVSRTDAVYLSSDPTLDPTDTLVGGPWAETAGVSAGGTYTRTREVAVTGLSGGPYFLIVKTDHDGDLFESDEADNTLAVGIQVESKPDLRPASCAPAGGVLNAGQPNNLTYVIANDGTAPAAGEWWDSVSISTDAIPDAGDYHLGWGPTEAGPIAPGTTYEREMSVSIPELQPGTYYLLVNADAYQDNVAESDETDNLLAVPVSVVAPDLLPATCVPSSTLVCGQSNLLTYTVRNNGTGEAPAAEGWYDSIYLSADGVLDTGDTHLGYSGWESGPVAPGAEYERTMKIALPQVPAGSYYLIVSADDYWNTLFEGDEANNATAFPVTVAAVDLRPTTFAVGSGTPGSGATVTLDYSVTNGGDAEVEDGGSWWDAVYLSEDSVFGPEDTFLGWSSELFPPLTAGASYSQSIPVTLPTLAPGTWNLLLVADAWINQVIEGDETNNTRAIPFTVGDSFASWAAENGLTGDDALPGANPSGDGIPNQLKYAFGMDPNIAYGPDRILTPGTGTSGLPSITLDGGRLRIEFVRRTGATDLTYTAQFGSGLSDSGPGAWLPAGPGTATPIPGHPGWERVIVDDAAAPPGAATRFGRVAVTAE